MIMKFITHLLLPFCLLLIPLTYMYDVIVFDFKRNSDIDIPQRYKDINLYAANKSEKTSRRHKNKSLELVQNGIFWSDYAESLIPKGSQLNNSMEFVSKIRHQHVKKIILGSQRICGDAQNGIVEVEDATTLCVRYDKKKYHTVFAEALAFYLSRLLGMDNVPEVILSKVNGSSEQWKTIDLKEMGWEENKEVAMMKFINNTRNNVFMPLTIRKAYTDGKPVTSQIVHFSSLFQTSPSSTAELIQWGTLIIFDNLIGHTDRLFLYLSVKEGGRASRSLDNTLHNSIKSPNGKIWLIDNERGFFYGNEKESEIKHNFMVTLKLHDRMLKTMCIFQLSFVDKLRKLSKHPSAFQHLWNYTSFFEPIMKEFKEDRWLFLLEKYFNSRLNDVILWIEHCKSLGIK